MSEILGAIVVALVTWFLGTTARALSGAAGFSLGLLWAIAVSLIGRGAS